jgi:hypothetical protein
MVNNKSPAEYRWLADKCRETARTISAKNGRADLLAMAQTWDFIADRLERAPHCGENRRSVTSREAEPL